MVSVRTHNILDYVGAVILVLSPYLFGFPDIIVARNTFLVLGVGLAAYSLMTDYEFSLTKVIPLGTHMVLDVLAGIALLVAPYVFNYSFLLNDFQSAWHFVLGIGVIGLVSVTRRKPTIEAAASAYEPPSRTAV